jgi:hypothetical protein
MSIPRLRLQHPRAEHRNRRERHHQRHQNGGRERHRKFTKQPAEHAAHQKDRDEHRHQREGHRHDRKRNLLRAAERRVHRRQPLLTIPRDVFEHHDGIVHHKAGGDRERHEGEIVEAIPEQVHHAERGDQRHRHRHRRNQGGAQIPEKHEHHQNDQSDGNGQSALDVVQRGADDGRAVHDDRQRHTPRQRGLQLRELRTQPIDRFDDVGARLAINDHQHRRGPVCHPHGPEIFDGRFHRGHIGQLHRPPVSIGHDQRQILLRLSELVVGADFPGAVVAGQLPFRPIHVRTGQDLAHVSESNAVLIQGGRIEIHPDRRQGPASHGDLPDAFDLRQLLLQDAGGGIVHLPATHEFGRQGEDENGAVGRIHLAVPWNGRQIRRQIGASRIDGGLHVPRCPVDIAAQLELKRDVGPADRARRGHLRHARDTGELALQRRGDGRGHRLGARPRQRGRHIDRGKFDLRERGHRQELKRDDAHQRRSNGEQRRGDRPSHKGRRQVHR